MLTKIKSEVR